MLEFSFTYPIALERIGGSFSCVALVAGKAKLEAHPTKADFWRVAALALKDKDGRMFELNRQAREWTDIAVWVSWAHRDEIDRAWATKHPSLGVDAAAPSSRSDAPHHAEGVSSTRRERSAIGYADGRVR